MFINLVAKLTASEISKTEITLSVNMMVDTASAFTNINSYWYKFSIKEKYLDDAEGALTNISSYNPSNIFVPALLV